MNFTPALIAFLSSLASGKISLVRQGFSDEDLSLGEGGGTVNVLAEHATHIDKALMANNTKLYDLCSKNLEGITDHDLNNTIAMLKDKTPDAVAEIVQKFCNDNNITILKGDGNVMSRDEMNDFIHANLHSANGSSVMPPSMGNSEVSDVPVIFPSREPSNSVYSNTEDLALIGVAGFILLCACLSYISRSRLGGNDQSYAPVESNEEPATRLDQQPVVQLPVIDRDLTGQDRGISPA